VEGLLSTEVHAYQDVEALLEQGGAMRTMAAHNLNNFSSRSHAVFQLLLHTTESVPVGRPPLAAPTAVTPGKEGAGPAGEDRITTTLGRTSPPGRAASPAARSLSSQRKSKLYLIDLAGSERAKSTGCTGERLREASNINRSLSTLSEVIKVLSRQGQAATRYC
jgi:hypothetical protein